MSIYNFGLFTKSTLVFTGNDDQEHTLIAQLDRATSDQARVEIGHADTRIEIEYEGHLINPKTLPDAIANGSIGTGNINGEEMRIELVPTQQPSIAIARNVFGDRIKVKRLEANRWENV
ncbi:MAG: hypothetical protein F6K24_05125 [Okeania sp. SIO2D1]|nr:hypothetical protein [Okeania sp. SIO2D1]